HLGYADVPAYARAHSISLETAARELRHGWFAKLIAGHTADKIATAHTLDDQAETVLMRLIRGAGVRGLAGIFPVQQEKKLVRPLLAVKQRGGGRITQYLGQRLWGGFKQHFPRPTPQTPPPPPHAQPGAHHSHRPPV